VGYKVEKPVEQLKEEGENTDGLRAYNTTSHSQMAALGYVNNA
jgi:hypothetical protein